MWDMFVGVAIWGTPGDSISFLHFDQVIYSYMMILILLSFEFCLDLLFISVHGNGLHRYSTRADIWSAGSTLFELADGGVLFVATWMFEVMLLFFMCCTCPRWRWCMMVLLSLILFCWKFGSGTHGRWTWQESPDSGTHPCTGMTPL